MRVFQNPTMSAQYLRNWRRSYAQMRGALLCDNNGTYLFCSNSCIFAFTLVTSDEKVFFPATRASSAHSPSIRRVHKLTLSDLAELLLHLCHSIPPITTLLLLVRLAAIPWCIPRLSSPRRHSPLPASSSLLRIIWVLLIGMPRSLCLLILEYEASSELFIKFSLRLRSLDRAYTAHEV